MARFKFADMFAGIGGFRKAFEELGGKCVLTVETDKYCKITQDANYEHSEDHVWHDDINTLRASDFQDKGIDLVCAGFPCQPFSISGARKGTDDSRGTLFWSLAEAVKVIKPRVVLMENVLGLLSINKGSTYRDMLLLLEKYGYYSFGRILCSSGYVPQRRKRVFIVCFRKDPIFSPFIQIYTDNKRPILADILESEVDEKYYLSEKSIKSVYAHKKRHAERGNGFGANIKTEHEQSGSLPTSFRCAGSDLLLRETSKAVMIATVNSSRQGQRIYSHQGQGVSLVSKQPRQNLIFDGSPERIRRLTPRECSRMMGFDSFQGSDWIIKVNNTQAYKQFGNSVVVPLIKAIGQTLLPYLTND